MVGNLDCRGDNYWFRDLFQTGFRSWQCRFINFSHRSLGVWWDYYPNWWFNCRWNWGSNAIHWWSLRLHWKSLWPDFWLPCRMDASNRLWSRNHRFSCRVYEYLNGQFLWSWYWMANSTGCHHRSSNRCDEPFWKQGWCDLCHYYNGRENDSNRSNYYLRSLFW